MCIRDSSASAASGNAGTVLIDPTDLVISSNIYSGGGSNYILSAPQGSITVNDGVSVSTRNTGVAGVNQLTANSVGNSGNLTLQASQITLGTGSQVVAHANSGFNAGNVTIEATRAPGNSVDFPFLPINGGASHRCPPTARSLSLIHI